MTNLINTIVSEIKDTRRCKVELKNNFHLSCVKLSDCISVALFHNEEPHDIPNVYDYVVDCNSLEEFYEDYLPSIVQLASNSK